MFFKEVSSAHQPAFIWSKVQQKQIIYSCDFKAKFLASFQSHDPSEIILIFWFAAQIFIIIMLKTAVELFKFLWWIEHSEEQHLSEIEIICNIINVFIITFDQFKASLLNKSINLYNNNNNYTDYKLLNGIVYNVTKLFISH